MLQPIVPRFRSDISVLLKDITEKQVPAKLKPIVSNVISIKVEDILILLNINILSLAESSFMKLYHFLSLLI